MANAKNIDVFWYLEEVLIKKGLDEPDWYHARTIGLILDLIKRLRKDVEGFIVVGENVSLAVAKKSVDLFIAETKQELKKNPKDEPNDVTEDEEDEEEF